MILKDSNPNRLVYFILDQDEECAARGGKRDYQKANQSTAQESTQEGADSVVALDAIFAKLRTHFCQLNKIFAAI